MSYIDSVELKTRSFIRLINNLLTGEFPHAHSKDALTSLKYSLEADLKRFLESKNKPNIIYNNSITLNYKIVDLLPILGFILRSTNLRNAFEYYLPFVEICRALLGDQAKVILSTEWEFSPRTYPLNVAELPDFVFLGLPTFEAENALIIPLAGHELGHSVWVSRKLEDKFYLEVNPVVEQLYLDDAKKFSQVFPEYKPKDVTRDLFAETIRGISIDYTMCQCQEVFCDLIGIVLFAEGFLKAFEYLLAPGLGTARSEYYPSLIDRIDYILQGAKAFGVEVPANYQDEFDAEMPASGNNQNQFIVEKSDLATRQLFPLIITEVKKVIETCPSYLPSAAGRVAVLQNFHQGIPGRDPNSLADIINAGWVYISENRINFWEGDASDEHWRHLNDLIFKSIEVMECNRSLKLNDAGITANKPIN